MRLLDLIDRTEGAGNYSTLFGHAQRPGQPFAGVDVSRMTLGQLADFASPSGAYGQWVASQNNGTVATPMGRFQIVGSTLRRAASELGLGPETVFNQGTQDQLANHLLSQRLASANTMPGKLAALRNEWHGLRSVPDAQLAQAIGGPSFQGGSAMQPRMSASNAPGLLGFLSGDQGASPPQGLLGQAGEPPAEAPGMNAFQAAAMAFNTLRRNPDPNLPILMHRQHKDAVERFEKGQQRNQTVDWLRGNGWGNLAGAVEAGVMSGADAVRLAQEALQGQEPERGVRMGDRLVHPITGAVIADFSGQSRNTTAEWLRGEGHEEMASAVEAGVLSGKDAFDFVNRKPDPKEAEIARHMEGGLTRAEAIELADNVRVAAIDPRTGEAQIISKLTGLPVAAQEAPAAQSTTPEPSFGDTISQPSQDQFGEQFTDSDRAFGLGGFARGAANTASDALGLGLPFPGVAATQRDFNVIGESLINLIAQSYPRQPAQRLLLQAQELLPKAGIPWAGPEGARDKLAAFGRNLLSERASVERQLGTRKMRPNVRQQLESQLAVLDQALDMVSKSHGSFGADGTPAADPSDIDLMNRLLSDG